MSTRKWLRAAIRCGTGLAATIVIGNVAEAGDQWVASPAYTLDYAALTSETTADSGPATGSYTLDDSEALLYLLDAPAPDTTDGAEIVPSAMQQDVTSLQLGHLDLGKNANSPEAKAIEAWEFQAGKVVPEPSTVLLMGFGLAAFAAFRNKFNRTS
ncbi:MAG: PEP-CTERM sorting domain-containing protein [Candidatus Hydrogenedentes bacterium]|nr:PEP-CTERM sorting domain-containing protein [Candidatus Hydrogenedentota bacterium]